MKHSKSAAIVSVVTVAIAGFVYWPQRWIQDDAYISFRFARNLVRGFGLVYNPGEYVEGYTNFLWTLCMSAPIFLGAEDPLNFSHVIGMCLLGAYYSTCVFAICWVFVVNPIYALWTIAPVLFFSSFNLWFIGGMEQGLVSFLLLLLPISAFGFEQKRLAKVSFVFFMFALVLLPLARPDELLSSIVFITLIGFGIFMRKFSPKYFWILVSIAAAVWTTYLSWKFYFYGDLVPNTAYAKKALRDNWSRGIDYLNCFWGVYGSWTLLAANTFLFFVTWGFKRLVLLAVWSLVVLRAIYLAKIGGDFMEWRFIVPTYCMLVVVTLSLMVDWLNQKPNKSRLITLTICSLFISIEFYYGSTLSNSRFISGQEPIASLAKYAPEHLADWRGTGKLLKEKLPEGLVLGTTAAGMIPYYCDCKVIDLHGLTDSQIARQLVPVSTPGRVGHELELVDIGVMREMGINTLLRWPHLWPQPVPASAQNQNFISLPRADGRFTNLEIINDKYREEISKKL